MAGIVLALAGLTPGDGGPGIGAARAPVEVSFVGKWEGTLQVPTTAGGAVLPVKWDFERGEFRLGGAPLLRDFRLNAVGNRCVRATHFGKPMLHTCRWHGLEVRIHSAEDGQVLLLRPTRERQGTKSDAAAPTPRPR
jgi:hypothetical protein